MYSRSMARRGALPERREPDPVNHYRYSVPPGYDGSRFVREKNGAELLPDSAFRGGGDGTPKEREHTEENKPAAASPPPEAEEAACGQKVQKPPSPMQRLGRILGAADRDQLLLAALMVLLYTESNRGPGRDDQLMFVLALLLISH